jgi:hypothetical protein
MEVRSQRALLVPPGVSTSILVHTGTLHFQGQVDGLTEFSATRFEAINMTSSGETEVTGKLKAGGLINLFNVRSDSIRAHHVWVRNCCQLGSRAKVDADAVMIGLLVGGGGKEAVVEAKQGIYVKAVTDFDGRLKAATRAKIGLLYNDVRLHNSKVRVLSRVGDMSIDPRAMTPGQYARLESSIERFMETEVGWSPVKRPDDVYLALVGDVRAFPSREAAHLASYITRKRLGRAGPADLPRASVSPNTQRVGRRSVQPRGP